MLRWSFVVVAGCAGHAVTPRTPAAFRAACAADEVWDGRTCVSQLTAREKLAAASQALTELRVDEAAAALAQIAAGIPLEHASLIRLWEQRGIAAAYLDDVAGAKAAFDILLAVDPGHFVSYTLSPKATFVFEEVRKQPGRIVPAIDITWPRGSKVGDAIPLDLEVLADPRHFLARATLFVRTRGEADWRAADVALGGPGARHVILPPVQAHKPTSLELYARGYDDRGNEVLAWAGPAQPREIPLRFDPPPPWYRTWWALAIASSVVAIGTGVTVYELTLAPPDRIGGSASVAR